MNETILGPGERLDPVNERLSLICKTDGLTFGTDAYLLAAFMRPAKRARAVELGTGTGIISLLCAARERFSTIEAWELQPDFAELAERNVRLNRLEARITVRQGDIRSLTPTALGTEVDVVFANPPYMRTDSGKRNESDYKYIARHEVCGTVGDFCATAGRILKHGGKFYCVFRPDRLSELMGALAECRLEPKTAVFVHGDARTEPSMVLIEATKGAAPGMRILPPLFLHELDDRGEGKRRLSSRAAEIYETMSFYERAREKEE
ncbi:MAG: methyltransferase [Clostridia bacterium]|nr:methyltransferase [Clostridia bacterium]